jgi:DNA-directed RNA polymerase subunit omega
VGGVLEKAASGRKPIPKLSIAFSRCRRLPFTAQYKSLGTNLNAELTKKALEKVGNPNVLVNLISRRVRQLNAGAGALSRPLLTDVGNMGAADIALLEIVEGKLGFEMPETVELVRPTAKKRKKH